MVAKRGVVFVLLSIFSAVQVWWVALMHWGVAAVLSLQPAQARSRAFAEALRRVGARHPSPASDCRDALPPRVTMRSFSLLGLFLNVIVSAFVSVRREGTKEMRRRSGSGSHAGQDRPRGHCGCATLLDFFSQIPLESPSAESSLFSVFYLLRLDVSNE